jgi:hypothetical protein
MSRNPYDTVGISLILLVAADGSMGKARNGGDQIGPNPADRAKQRSKKSLLVDGQGGPLAIIVAPANVNDHFLLCARQPLIHRNNNILCAR